MDAHAQPIDPIEPIDPETLIQRLQQDKVILDGFCVAFGGFHPLYLSGDGTGIHGFGGGRDPASGACGTRPSGERRAAP